ncbi:hypothetical protein JCM19237_274 [Photobacterium aphoticum]|uniref:Plasmid segregation protein ParM/StbA N-terminal domain-containing protein n=1 Tax=Photobacterium aphoticum TaxID=754436 RepID=A0A090R1B2_9GAMM|nr:hypothetical protein JCM19237_274 [Photobacterium aphoticum]
MSDKKALEQGKVVPFLFAIDDGSGNMEIHFEDAKGNVFESKSASCVVEAVLADLAGGISNNAWETEGKQYTVAKSHTDAMDTCSAKYQLSPANRVLVHNAIAETGVGSQPVYLGVTLPTEQFYTVVLALSLTMSVLSRRKRTF